MGHRIPHAPLALALALLSLLILAPSAPADFVIGSQGTDAGQYERPRGVAVDTSNGNVYVADQQNNRVDVFDSTGSFLFAFGWKVNKETPEEKLQTCTPATGCLKGSPGAGAGQLNHPEQIAVDSSSHVVYVSETGNYRVQKFDAEGHFLWMVGGEVDTVTHANLCTVAANCGVGVAAQKEAGKEEGRFFFSIDGSPLALGPGGVLYVADSRRIGTSESEGFNTRIQRFEPSGAYLGPQLILPGTVRRVGNLAVDSSEDLYVELRDGIHKYNSAGNPISGWGEGGKVELASSFHALALDPSGDLFASDAPPSGPEILEFDPASGAKTRVFFSPLLNRFAAWGLAVYHSASGDLFAVEENVLLRISLPEPGPLIAPGSTVASPIGNVRATLKVFFNPENKPSHAHFEYISRAAFEANLGEAKEGFEGAAVTPDSPDTPADFTTQTVAAVNTCAVPTEATCLKPETTYYFRAIAANEDGEVTSEKAEFTTLPPLEVKALWSSDVGTDTARLHAEVNPLGIEATAYFQYIEEGPDYQEHGFEHAISAPEPTNPLDFGSGEAPLARATQLYPLEPGTTYHYRLVAEDPYFPPLASATGTFTTLALPAEAETKCTNQAFRSGPAAALPDCRAYEMVTPLDKNNGDVLTRVNITGYPTNLDQSSAEGQGFTYSSYRAFADPEGAPYTNQYLASRDPQAGWQTDSIDPPREGQFRFELETPYQAFSADLSSGWLRQESEPTLDPCAPAGFADLYRRDSSSGSYQALSCVKPTQVTYGVYMPELQGFSVDGSHALIRIDEALTKDASSATEGYRPIYQVYESFGAGQLRLISVLPSGEAAGKDSSAGTGIETDVANHNRFQNLDRAISTNATRVFWSIRGGSIYLRINADQKQSKVEAGKCTEAAKACTIAVSETVSKEPTRFQAGNPQGTMALFTIEGAGPLKGNLYRFDSEAEPPASQLIAEGVQGSILGASEDLSRVYFISSAATAQQQAEGATQGKPNVYLYDEGATRFIATLSSGTQTSDVSNPYGTPNATSPIFRTARVSPDGQSLAFMSNGKELSEKVAGYDNTDAASGEADAEVYLYEASAEEGKGALRCVSCNPSGARPAGRAIGIGGFGAGTHLFAAARVPLFETELYQPRYLTDDGSRVFFDSYEGLVLADTNGKQDVYEWEAADSGSCSEESPAYVPSSAGCLHLLSSGQSPADSEFLDADPSGANAFFTTAEGLLPQDYGLIDIYDARVNGGFPPPPSTPPACEGEACQSPPEPPNDPTPASSAFEGAGNVVEKAASRKHHKKQKAKHRRAKHNRANHKRRAAR